MVKGSLKLHIPGGHGRDTSDPLLREILQQANVHPREWKNL